MSLESKCKSIRANMPQHRILHDGTRVPFGFKIKNKKKWQHHSSKQANKQKNKKIKIKGKSWRTDLQLASHSYLRIVELPFPTKKVGPKLPSHLTWPPHIEHKNALPHGY